MLVVQCVSAFNAVKTPVLVCLRSSCNHVTSMNEGRKIFEARAEGCRAKWRELRERKPAVQLAG